MARRTPEEILAQRDAWMARKAAREAGEDVPMQPPLKPGEEAEVQAEAPAEEQVQPEVSETAEPEAAPAEEAPQPKEAEPAQPEPEPQAGQPAAGAPQKPAQRRTPEEILAQREAWMARKAARAAGQAPPAPAPSTPAEKPAPAPKKADAKSAPAPKKAAAKKPAPRKKAAPEPEPVDPYITRREMLNYAWLASIGLFTLQSVGVTLWFAFPNFKEGEFGGTFPLGPANSVVPEVNSPPVPYTDGKFWLVNVDTENSDGESRIGVLALFKVCTHLGCLYDWADVTTRFECPCHGSKFTLSGEYIAGPARRSLDRFVIEARNPDGTVRVQTNENGDPLEVLPDDVLVIDTGQIILGSSDIVPA